MVALEKRNGQSFYKPIPDVRSSIELSYYSNSLIAHFALDAIVVTSIQKLSIIHQKEYPNQVCTSQPTHMIECFNQN